MPEAQVLNAFARRIWRTLERAYSETGYWPEGVLRLFPRTWAEGTAVKAHKTFSVDVGDYCKSLEPSTISINEHDEKRFPDSMPGRYLLSQKFTPGPVHVAVRGKCLAITVGHHALVCHFNLEGNVRPMKRLDFEKLVATCVPGNNKNPAKAERLRSFVSPPKFLEPGARKKKTIYKINILAAVVMDDDVIIVTDFSRMSQLHVVSSFSVLQESDLCPGSALWKTRLWSRFLGGPDWIVETDAALCALDTWCMDVIRRRVTKPILDVLLEVDGPGAGMGQHLANDLLFGIALHPDTPSLTICLSDELYSELRTHIPAFMATFASPLYLQRCAGDPNSDNPFVFHEVSNTNFLRTYVLVYRKLEVRVPAILYNLYQSRGTPYHRSWTPTTQIVAVQLFEDSQNNRYHIIRAKPPADWADAHTEPNSMMFQTQALQQHLAQHHFLNPCKTNSMWHKSEYNGQAM
ncbi:hypothetical protein MVEN_00718500 [Mycena venus]|uniref:Uncharacterized protein n=1 Tax=Mycena venus TaxID=2733690 RepID=A0A8H6YEZ3_9AGAR|nr:hypothetical protein MVEN_00718500 [Mycena venus]